MKILRYSRFSNADRVQNISHSIYVTNFPDSATSRDLWNACSVYGTVVDVFIPLKKSKVDFQDSPDDEEDAKSSQEYMNDLEEEYQRRDLLAKSKIFFKKGTQRFSGAKATNQIECRKCGRKAKYNKVKAMLALLSSTASASNSSLGKNKGIIDETYEWDEEEVSSDENEGIEVKALMALIDEERVFVGKESTNNGEWVKISIQKVHTLLEMEDNDDRKSFQDYLCIDLNYFEEKRNNLLSKHRNLVQELNTCKE
uniref:Retrovirus-related Pol polyprotein from transposon TNT 1-94 n=1 Tax=Tanacetum cinerariifolium TaxID=118510 RepID=A0A699I878_TANCI|nr:retrovirus-related Pol polyprotein from transposon TNT 1-94 [Tanacetum cinerariifolium]